MIGDLLYYHAGSIGNSKTNAACCRAMQIQSAMPMVRIGHQLKVTNQKGTKTYLYHLGQPVVALWGFWSLPVAHRWNSKVAAQWKTNDHENAWTPRKK